MTSISLTSSSLFLLPAEIQSWKRQKRETILFLMSLHIYAFSPMKRIILRRPAPFLNFQLLIDVFLRIPLSNFPSPKYHFERKRSKLYQQWVLHQIIYSFISTAINYQLILAATYYCITVTDLQTNTVKKFLCIKIQRIDVTKKKCILCCRACQHAENVAGNVSMQRMSDI